MFAQESHFGVPWQKLAYIVDVRIQTIDDVPRVTGPGLLALVVRSNQSLSVMRENARGSAPIAGN
jgi:hypothetical protein